MKKIDTFKTDMEISSETDVIIKGAEHLNNNERNCRNETSKELDNWKYSSWWIRNRKVQSNIKSIYKQADIVKPQQG